MTLQDIFDHTLPQTNLLIYFKLDCGTEESFTVELCRGEHRTGWRKEYYDWINGLGLEVEKISACKEDVLGNKDLLCIECKPIKINERR